MVCLNMDESKNLEFNNSLPMKIMETFQFSETPWEKDFYKLDPEHDVFVQKGLDIETKIYRYTLEKPCVRDPRSPAPLTLAVQNSLTL